MSRIDHSSCFSYHLQVYSTLSNVNRMNPDQVIDIDQTIAVDDTGLKPDEYQRINEVREHAWLNEP